LAEGILKIFADPELGEKLGAQGFENVRRHYDVKHMADRALEVYEEIGRGFPQVLADELEQTIEKAAVT
jgi:glycosyltransferase involved in cell wall biosynthesis